MKKRMKPAKNPVLLSDDELDELIVRIVRCSDRPLTKEEIQFAVDWVQGALIDGVFLRLFQNRELDLVVVDHEDPLERIAFRLPKEQV